MDGIILTRESLLRLAGFNPVKDLKRARKATLAALQATHPDDPEVPDHTIQLKASDQFYRIYGAYSNPKAEDVDTGRPVNVTIVLAGPNDAGAALQTHGVRLHLNGDTGASA